MASYSDVEKAVRVEMLRIWSAWVCGGIIWLIITNATRNIAVVSVITQVLLVALGALSTIAAVTMANRLNRKLMPLARKSLAMCDTVPQSQPKTANSPAPESL